MIVNKIEKYSCYKYGEAWSKAFKYLTKLTPDIANGKYEIQGNDIYAIISSYQTKTREKFERHSEYADIQYILAGEEILEYTSLKKLKIASPYDKEKDIEFYHPAKTTETAIYLKPGIFALFLANEVHMPGLIYNNRSSQVKKVVIKIKNSLLIQ